MSEVEAILDKKITKDGEFYKIKWKGNSNKEATWESLSNLSRALDMISDFEKRQPSSLLKRKLKEDLKPSAEKDKDRKHHFNGKRTKRNVNFMNTYEDYGFIQKAKSLFPRKEKLRKLELEIRPTPSLTFDIPKQIITVTMTRGELEVIIEWEDRQNGELLGRTSHPAKEMRKHKHLALLLIEYYESIV